MKKGAPYKVVWKVDGKTVGDYEGIEKKAVAVSWAVALRKYIAMPIQILNDKGNVAMTIEPVVR